MKSLSDTNELAVVEKILPMVEDPVSSLVISDTTSLTLASEYLSKTNKLLDSLTADKEKIVRPINQSLKEIRLKYKPAETRLEGLIATLRTKMTEYQTRSATLRKQQEQAIADRVAPGKGNLSIETASNRIAALPTPQKSLDTDTGSVTFIETKVFEVTALADLPLAFHLPNEILIRKAMKDGIELKGVTYRIIQVPRNNR